MSFRNNKKRKARSGQHLPVGEGRFVALRFVDTLDELYDKTESIIANPNITFNGNNVVVDYGHVLNTSGSSLEKVNFFFKYGLNKNDIITLSNGEYLNEMSGDSEIRDYSGTYHFKSFDSNLLIASLEKISINNESSYYNKLNKNYFISNSIKWTTTSSEKKIVKTNEIVNELGADSLNSFINTFGEIKENDILEIIIPNEEIKRFTIREYKLENDIERVTVEEDVSGEEDLFGTPTFARLLRNPGSGGLTSTTLLNLNNACCLGKLGCFNQTLAECEANSGTYHPGKNCSDKPCPKEDEPQTNRSSRSTTLLNLNNACCLGKLGCFNQTLAECEANSGTYHPGKNCSDKPCPKEDEPQTNRSSTPKATRTPPIVRPSSTSKNRVESSKNKKSYENKWNNSGKEIFNVEVTVQGGRNVYAINGTPQKQLNLIRGETYRFNTKHSSLGNKGFTNTNHPLIFSTRKDSRLPDGTIVNAIKGIWKSPTNEGNRGSYQYVTIPHSIKEKSIYYACHNHKNMGGVIQLSSSARLIPQVTTNDRQRMNERGGPDWDAPIIIAPPIEMCDCCDGIVCGDSGPSSDRTGGCWSCLWKAIRKVESSYVAGCETPCNCVGDNGNACGPFQIWDSYVVDAIEKCPGILTEFGLTGAAAAHGTLCEPCPPNDTACCTEKWNLSKRIIECYMLRYVKPGRGKYKGTGEDGCFTCEDIARMHNGGPCAHKPSNTGTDRYWNDVKNKMKEMCEENCECCDCCGSKSDIEDSYTPYTGHTTGCKKGSCGDNKCTVCCQHGDPDGDGMRLMNCYDNTSCEECECISNSSIMAAQMYEAGDGFDFVCKDVPDWPCGWEGCDERKYIGGCDENQEEVTLIGPCELLPPHTPIGGWWPECQYGEYCEENCVGNCPRQRPGPGSIGR